MTVDLGGYESWDDVRACLARGPEAWARLTETELADLHFLACVETALPEGTPPGPEHGELFRELVERTSLDSRWELLYAYRARLLETPGVVAPLFPFFRSDPQFDFAALAVGFLVDVWPRTGDDPLESLREVAHVGFCSPAPRARAATIAMLVGFGDPRLRPLWNERWRSLPRERKPELVQFVGALDSVEAVECLLRWLECGPVEDSRSVAYALGGLARRGAPLFQARRDFARRGGAFEGFTRTGRWAVAEYAREIAPRIRALAATGRGRDDVVHGVAEAWGVDLFDVAPGHDDWVLEAG